MKNKITDQLIIEQVNKHKKALFFLFFDTAKDLKIEELVVDSAEENKVRDIVVFENGHKVIYENAPDEKVFILVKSKCYEGKKNVL